MDIRLDNKVAVITGGTGGLGVACAEVLAASGAKVALIGRGQYSISDAVKKVQERGVAKGYQLDVTDIPAIAPTINQIRQDLGEVDILVCFAGTDDPRPPEDVTEANWDAIVTPNIKGLFFCNQAVAVQSMIPRKTGAIVNITSIYGLVGAPERVPYCTSKGGVVQLTRAEAVNWARYNIRVNAVAPTWILTPSTAPMLKDPELKAYVLANTPLGRLGTVDDIATAVCFLASDEAKMITGVTLPVDGGWTAQ